MIELLAAAARNTFQQNAEYVLYTTHGKLFQSAQICELKDKNMFIRDKKTFYTTMYITF